MRQSKELYEEIIGRMSSLNGNMAVLSKLNTLLKDTDADLDEAVRLIQTDGALSANILRLSNSAEFGGGEKVASLAEAVQKVGFEETIKLVGLALSNQVFMRDLAAYGISADDYWRQSYLTANFMEMESKVTGKDYHTAYLLGLVHSIGRVVIDELIREARIEVFWDRTIRAEDWELATIGFSSDHAGALLLKGWGFDGGIYKRVAKQSDEAVREKDLMLQLLDLAKQAAIFSDQPDAMRILHEDRSHPYVASRGYGWEEVEAIRVASSGIVDEVLMKLQGTIPRTS